MMIQQHPLVEVKSMIGRHYCNHVVKTDLFNCNASTAKTLPMWVRSLHVTTWIQQKNTESRIAFHRICIYIYKSSVNTKGLLLASSASAALSKVVSSLIMASVTTDSTVQKLHR